MTTRVARRVGMFDQQFGASRDVVAQAARRAAERVLLSRQRQHRARGGGAIEALEERRLLSSIAGTLWNDANANHTQDAGESPLANWVVYLDQNRNHTRDSGEVFTTTNASGG